ncbi:glucose dehydrogenase [FAD, quinone]-like [Copidosoma floridanum]|uniref:glucose dehydrogenase [FAD, quinone]-like n=1 Tax=Copidosoma floridanum TaxID=29053 RepID=UPI000C6FB572|nr:glucose dehydrogenase [FAD, quinone]-like [Copidosoma floridanum]
MAWSPANIANCAGNSSGIECRPELLAFISFLVQYIGYSYDQLYPEKRKKSENEENDNDEYNFIIVGAGSAGCVLANRLTEVHKWKVLLLEAGDEQPIISDIPAARPLLLGSSIDWMYKTQPERHACLSQENSTCSWPRGKTIGGSSSINAMWYVRGVRQDYDGWANLGNIGWSYDDVYPYFIKQENLQDPELLAKYPDSYGTDGPLAIERNPYNDKNHNLLKTAFKEMGLPEINYNTDSSVIGTADLQFTNNHGARHSVNSAYIRPIRGKRENLIIRPNSLVTKVVIDEKTKQATHVEYVDLKTKKTRIAVAKKEIIVSAGAIESPKLLMLSGIGAADELREANIKVINDLPGVGKNLQDHFNVLTIQVNFDNKTSEYSTRTNMENDFANWMSTHGGPLSGYGLMNIVTFYQTPYETTPGVPDIQIACEGILNDPSTNKDIPYTPSSYYNQFLLVTTLLNPKSRGQLKLNTTDPISSPPLIYANYYNDSRDVKAVIAGMGILRNILNTKTFKTRGFKEIISENCKQYPIHSEQYDHCIIKYNTGTGFHPVGTCKMGPKSDPMAVVDSELNVYGIKGLRVIDASIMPIVTRGNTNGPTIMIAEKLSDSIKKRWI